mmetsp:Transcript_56180/g.130836  ORF Transcript_56180/g.130836 Transcript_56180/m.130836 type:complete len:309 (+) Transcript_56180:469-1395(+)
MVWMLETPQQDGGFGDRTSHTAYSVVRIFRREQPCWASVLLVVGQVLVGRVVLEGLLVHQRLRRKRNQLQRGLLRQVPERGRSHLLHCRLLEIAHCHLGSTELLQELHHFLLCVHPRLHGCHEAVFGTHVLLEPHLVEGANHGPTVSLRDSKLLPLDRHITTLNAGLHPLDHILRLGRREKPVGVPNILENRPLLDRHVPGLILHLLDDLLRVCPKVGRQVVVLHSLPLLLDLLTAPLLAFLKAPASRLKDLYRGHQAFDGAPHACPFAELLQQVLHHPNGVLAPDNHRVEHQHLRGCPRSAPQLQQT